MGSRELQARLEANLRILLQGSDLCEVIWKPWTTPWGAVLSKPRARVRTISETDTGLWRTMNTREKGGGEYSDPEKARQRLASGHQINLQDQVLTTTGVWQTPVADDAVDRVKGKVNSRGEPKLSGQAIQAEIRKPKMVPTRRGDKLRRETTNEYWARMEIEDPMAPPQPGQSTWPTPRVTDNGGNGSPLRAANHKARLEDCVQSETIALWSKIRASDGEKGGPNMSFGAGGQPLPSQAAQSTWKSPSAGDGSKMDALPPVILKRMEAGQQIGLAHQVRMVWPTPTSLSGGSETSNPPGNSRNNNNIRKHAIWATATSHERSHTPRQVHHGVQLANQAAEISNGSSAPTAKRGALNPEFVCWLMGFPIEWVSCGASVTRSTRGRRRPSSKPRVSSP